MGIAHWHRWQWIIAGILCGLVVAYFYGRPAPPTHARRISAQEFENTLLADGSPLSKIYVYPAHEGVYLLTFAGPLSEDSADKVKEYAYAVSPFITESGKEPDVLAYLRHQSAQHPTITYSYLWQKEDVWRYLVMAAAFALILGGPWASVLQYLTAAGLGPPEPQYDLSRFGKHSEKKESPKQLTPADMSQLQSVNAELEKDLVPTSENHSAPSETSPAPIAIMALSAKPLEQLPEETKEDKEYRGEFYPTARGPRHTPPESKAFSLVELLVVIGIIALLISILLPVLSKARQSSLTIQCASNLRQIGAGLAMYLIENQNTYPPSYLYIGHSIVDGVQTPETTANGYIHWSTYLYSSGHTPAAAFQCPAMNRGGLPPTDPAPDNLDPGQVIQNPGVVDQQVSRIAYTLNEALCPRNKFVLGFQGAVRVYQFVKASQVANSSGTILCTEWIDSDRATGEDESTSGWIMSHRPIHGFVGNGSIVDMYLLSPGAGFRRATAADLDPDPVTAASTKPPTLLDWVGRNHGQKADYPDHRLTNFLYVDGHVMTKSIYDTFQPFEWGEKFYTLNPNDDFQQ